MIRQVKESFKQAAYGYCLGQPHRLSDCLILSRWRLESLFVEFCFKLAEFPYEEPGTRRHLVFNFLSGMQHCLFLLRHLGSLHRDNIDGVL